MNKGEVGLGGGAGGGGEPTAAAAVAEAQKQKTIMQRVDTDVGNLADNFGFLVNVAWVNDPPVRNSQESFMMEMHAARMVQAADSLLKLVSELKQTAIFSGFASLNDRVNQRTEEFNKLDENTNTSGSNWRRDSCKPQGALVPLLLFNTQNEHSPCTLKTRWRDF